MSAGERELQEFPKNWEDMDVLLEVSKRLDEIKAALLAEDGDDEVLECLADILGKLATIVRIERLRQRSFLRTEPGGEDAARLAWLERTVRNLRYDHLIQWDHEDGFWLSRIAKGTHPQPTALGGDEPARDLRAAIDGAMEQSGVVRRTVEPDRKEGWRSRLARRLRAAAGPQGIEHMEMEDGAVLTQQDLEQAALTLEHCEEHHDDG